MAYNLDYFSLYAIGRIIETEPLIHTPRLYWVGFFCALYTACNALYRAFIFEVYFILCLAYYAPCMAYCGLICKALYYNLVFLCCWLAFLRCGVVFGVYSIDSGGGWYQ